MMAAMSHALQPPRPEQTGSGAGLAAGDVAGQTAGGPLDVVITGEDWLQAICPFLRARDGSWRSASPVREHRCWAMDPPSELPVLTQQRLCLVRAHDACERFLHARELRSASLASTRVSSVDTPAAGVPARGGGSRRSTVAADAARGAAAGVLRSPRLVAAAAAVGAVVLGVLLIVAVGGNGTERGPADGSFTSASSASPSTGIPASPTQDGLQRYRVREGDTLRTIADRFGVSVRQLRLANDLGEPPRLEVGMVIVIPAD
jgi:LysM repeat protein